MPLDVLVGRALERARVRGDHVVPRTGLAGEPLALLERAIPARILDDAPRPPVERLVLIVEPVLGELGEPLVHRLAIRARSACSSWTSWIACSLPNSPAASYSGSRTSPISIWRWPAWNIVLERGHRVARASGGAVRISR